MKKKHTKNLEKWAKQGIGCCDTYSLYWGMADLIKVCLNQFLVDLKKFPGYPTCYPEIKTMRDWQNYIKGIIKDIEVWQKYTNSGTSFERDAELEEKAREALERFAKIWRSLWL